MIRPLFEPKTEQEIININAKQYLKDTDCMVLRHRYQVAAGQETSLTDVEYQQLLVDRQNARDSIVH